MKTAPSVLIRPPAVWSSSHQQRLSTVFLAVSFHRSDSFVTIEELFIQIGAALHPLRQIRNTSASEGRISLKPSVKPIRSDYMPGVFNKRLRQKAVSPAALIPLTRISCISCEDVPFAAVCLPSASTLRPARSLDGYNLMNFPTLLTLFFNWLFNSNKLG